MRLVSILPVLGLVVSGIPSADAAIFTFTNEAAFRAAVSGEKLESFETYQPTGVGSNSLTLTDFSMSALPAPNNSAPLFMFPLQVFLGYDPGLNANATHGNAWARYQSDANETLRFVFNSPVQNFGVNIIDWGDTLYSPGSLILSTDLNDSHTIASAPQGNGNVMFFGLINTSAAFSTIDLLSQPQLNTFGVDEVYYAARSTVIPEPAMLFVWSLLFASSLLVPAWRRLSARGSV
jgi:hypothetical protein